MYSDKKKNEMAGSILSRSRFFANGQATMSCRFIGWLGSLTQILRGPFSIRPNGYPSSARELFGDNDFLKELMMVVGIKRRELIAGHLRRQGVTREA